MKDVNSRSYAFCATSEYRIIKPRYIRAGKELLIPGSAARYGIIEDISAKAFNASQAASSSVKPQERNKANKMIITQICNLKICR